MGSVYSEKRRTTKTKHQDRIAKKTNKKRKNVICDDSSRIYNQNNKEMNAKHPIHATKYATETAEKTHKVASHPLAALGRYSTILPTNEQHRAIVAAIEPISTGERSPNRSKKPCNQRIPNLSRNEANPFGPLLILAANH